MADYRYLKGSEWKKWDLHVHTPGTKLGDKFIPHPNKPAWETWLEKIKENNLFGVGVTDYFSIDNYEKALEEKEKNPEFNSVIFLPNIEFRINQQNKDGDFINIHVVFSNAKNIVNKIPAFLNRLPLVSTDDGNHTSKYCCPTDLAQVGYDKAMVTLKNLEDCLENNFKKIEDYIIVGLARGYGSIRPASNDDGRGAEYAKEIDKKCHSFFGSIDDRAFYLNEAGQRSGYNLTPKPIIFASDAHNFNDIGKKFTWIKGELTFEGLKQILYEPDYRIKISPNKPNTPLYKLEKLTLDFPDRTFIEANNKSDDLNEIFCLAGKHNLDFSSQFTCIIGGRGTGKSMLFNIISESLEKKPDFFQKNKLTNNSSVLNITNYTSIEKTEASDLDIIGQNQIEEYARSSEKLTTVINKRLVNDEVRELEKDFADQIERIKEQTDIIFAYKETNDFIEKSENEVKEKKKLVSTFEDDEFKRIDNLIKTANVQLSEYHESRELLDNFIVTAQEVFEEFPKQKSFSKNNEYAKFYNSLLEKLASIITEYNKSIEKNKFDGVEKETENLEKELQKSKQSLQDFLKERGIEDEQRLEIANTREEITSIESQIQIKRDELQKLDKNIAEFNINGFIKTADSLKTKIDELITPISRKLSDIDERFISLVSPIELQQSFDVDRSKEYLCEKFCRIFNEYILEHSERLSVGHLKNVIFDKLEIKELLETDNVKFLASLARIKKSDNNAWSSFYSLMQDKYYFMVFNLLAHQFLLDYVAYRRFNVIYGKRPITKCSFGQRCTAILQVLLLLGNKPVVLDEPEAHLDNRLISDYLVELIKKQKPHRQIIFATHNANFVINGDAELIYILEIDDTTNKTTLTPTTIENLKTREKLLSLEGGKEAFSKRERRYELN